MIKMLKDMRNRSSKSNWKVTMSFQMAPNLKNDMYSYVFVTKSLFYKANIKIKID